MNANALRRNSTFRHDLWMGKGSNIKFRSYIHVKATCISRKSEMAQCRVCLVRIAAYLMLTTESVKSMQLLSGLQFSENLAGVEGI